MLWLLSSFEHPKHMFKLIGKKINAILGTQTILIWTYDNFLISQPKYILWVLKRTISMRRFFWAPKIYVKTNR